MSAENPNVLTAVGSQFGWETLGGGLSGNWPSTVVWSSFFVYRSELRDHSNSHLTVRPPLAGFYGSTVVALRSSEGGLCGRLPWSLFNVASQLICWAIGRFHSILQIHVCSISVAVAVTSSDSSRYIGSMVYGI